MPDAYPTVAVLLGAGASADAGIPTTATMTQEIRALLQWPRRNPLLFDYVSHILDADVARRRNAAKPSEVVPVVDIERLFASVELLIDRHDQPWSPFVGTWSSGLESFASSGDRPNRRHHEETRLNTAINTALHQVSRGNFRNQNLGDSIKRVIDAALESIDIPDVSVALTRLRHEMIESLAEILVPRNDVSYLGEFATLAEAQGAVTVATLNYDRTVELAAEALGATCDTAIETWLVDEHAWPSNGIRLLKLHGSIDWVLGVGDGPLPLTTVRPLEDQERATRPAIVFGEGGKLRSEGPYLELLHRWTRALEESDRLLIVGYSFRDDHVNEGIARWFNQAENRRIVLLAPDDLPDGWQAQRRYPVLARLVGVNRSQRPTDEPPPRRFWHVQATARDGLAEAIQIAREPNAWARLATE